MRISDWSSDVCSSDLRADVVGQIGDDAARRGTERSGIDCERIAFDDLQPLRRGALQTGQCRDAAGIAFDRDDMPRAFDPAGSGQPPGEIRSAACRGRVCQYWYISVDGETFKKK